MKTSFVFTEKHQSCMFSATQHYAIFLCTSIVKAVAVLIEWNQWDKLQVMSSQSQKPYYRPSGKKNRKNTLTLHILMDKSINTLFTVTWHDEKLTFIVITNEFSIITEIASSMLKWIFYVHVFNNIFIKTPICSPW